MAYEIDNLGRVIKKIRLEQKRTIEMIAEKCGFSKSLLSKIENGKVIPAIATLAKISQALRVKISTVLEDDGGFGAIYTSAEDLAKGAIPTKAGYSMRPFATDYTDKKMQPFIVMAEKGKVKMKDLSHEGQELIFVIKGAMKFKVGQEVFEMKKGDSLYFNSLEKHSILPTSNRLEYLNIFV